MFQAEIYPFFNRFILSQDETPDSSDLSTSLLLIPTQMSIKRISNQHAGLAYQPGNN